MHKMRFSSVFFVSFRFYFLNCACAVCLCRIDPASLVAEVVMQICIGHRFYNFHFNIASFLVHIYVFINGFKKRGGNVFFVQLRGVVSNGKRKRFVHSSFASVYGTAPVA